jgi:hypothetical protein
LRAEDSILSLRPPSGPLTQSSRSIAPRLLGPTNHSLYHR